MAEKSAIIELESSVERLLDDHKRISKLNSKLTKERDQLQRKNRELQERVTELTRELTIQQLSYGLGDAKGGSSASRDKARARINNLMREVDKCIALLSRVEDDVKDEK